MAESLLHFVETSVFTKQIDKLASVEILIALQNELLVNPTKGDIIPGTNGARKARIGDKTQNRGKSGAFRYVYVYFEIAGVIYLLLFYAKKEQANLTQAEKKEVAQFIAQAKRNYGVKEDG